MHPIGPVENFAQEGTCHIPVSEHDLLLIHSEGNYYPIENRCGHFGLPLTDGRVLKNEIFCSQHGISFDLDTGQVKSRPWEDCEPINVYKLHTEDGHLFVDDSSMNNKPRR